MGYRHTRGLSSEETTTPVVVEEAKVEEKTTAEEKPEVVPGVVVGAVKDKDGKVFLVTEESPSPEALEQHNADVLASAKPAVKKKTAPSKKKSSSKTKAK